jgi:hypothetical protein
MSRRKDAGTLTESGARGHDIIDKKEAPPGQVQTGFERERPPHIGAPLPWGQPRLIGDATRQPKGIVQKRNLQGARDTGSDQLGMAEPAVATLVGGGRDTHHGIGYSVGRKMPGQESPQRRGDRAEAIVLEGAHDRAQRSIVGAERGDDGRGYARMTAGAVTRAGRAETATFGAQGAIPECDPAGAGVTPWELFHVGGRAADGTTGRESPPEKHIETPPKPGDGRIRVGHLRVHRRSVFLPVTPDVGQKTGENPEEKK